ncbi:MAG: XkdX family protein [Lawsonibacter sp.]|nr:XkdX family protein [Lawsonibacter sp.]
MFERLKRLYAAGRLSDDGLNAAVARGWISEKERHEITGAANTAQ